MSESVCFSFINHIRFSISIRMCCWSYVLV